MDKVELLRKFMQKHELDAIIIPTSDDHKSEYIADYWKCREWLSGFTGSAGTAVITMNHAGLWTDSRYFIQAEQELKKPFVLHKLKTRGPEYIEWLKSQFLSGANIGIDAQMFSYSEIESFTKSLNTSKIELVQINDPFANIWQKRPTLPQSKIFIHNESYCELNREEKIQLLQEKINSNETDYILISALDDIAWLLNLRGVDISYNPVFYSYVIIGKKETTVFIDNNKLNSETKKTLAKANIIIKPYSQVYEYLENIENSSIEIDINSINYKLYQCINSSVIIKKNSSKIASLKSIKSKKELKHYKNAQIRDGLAVCKFIQWLEEHKNITNISEIDAANKLEEFRKQGQNYMGLSFGTISAYESNAALPHYSPSIEKPTFLNNKGLYLVDSGAQYIDGTTDITRTISLGEATKDEITDFTLVLKGHIKVAMAVFPEGTRGIQIDTLARTAMWQYGKDFGHGTGHGIGYFLNVHEGPHGFSQAPFGASQTILEAGMLTSNEPGMYIEGKYGIRTENVLACIEHTENKFGKFLKFETITYCPIDKNLIDISMLDKDEIDWLNKYHKTVFELLEQKADKNLVEWLRIKTSPLK